MAKEVAELGQAQRVNSAVVLIRAVARAEKRGRRECGKREIFKNAGARECGKRESQKMRETGGGTGGGKLKNSIVLYFFSTKISGGVYRRSP